jgi:hypothetical protein
MGGYHGFQGVAVYQRIDPSKDVGVTDLFIRLEKAEIS